MWSVDWIHCKARAVIALPGGQRFEAKAMDEMQGTPWRPSTKHRGTNVRAHITDEEDQGDDEEEEPEEIQTEIYDEEDPGETVQGTAKEDVMFSRIGQSYNFTVKAPGCTEVWATPRLPEMQVHHW